jgi:hypothetical protein
MKNRVIPSEARNLALFLGPSEIPRFARNDRHFQSSEEPAVVCFQEEKCRCFASLSMTAHFFTASEG